MKKLSLVFFVVLLSFSANMYGQNVIGGVQASGMDMNTYAYGTISTFNLAKKVTTGSKYLYDTWQVGTIETEQGVIKDCPLNIDVQHNVVEINTDKGIRVVPEKMIKTIQVGFQNLNRQVFVNAKAVNGTQAQVAGLVELLRDENIKLVKHHYLYKKEGAYNAALDMGNDEIEYVIKSRYFLFDEGKLVEIATNKKKFLALFPEAKSALVATFIKQNDLSLKKSADLVTICDFLNKENIHTRG